MKTEHPSLMLNSARLLCVLITTCGHFLSVCLVPFLLRPGLLNTAV